MFLSFLVIFLKCYSIQLFDWELGRRKGSFLDVISMLKLKIHEKNLQKITPLLTKFALSFLFLSFPSSLLFEIKLLLFLSNVFSDPGGGVGVRALEVGRTKGRAEVVLWEGEVIFGSKTKKNIFHHHFWSWSKNNPQFVGNLVNNLWLLLLFETPSFKLLLVLLYWTVSLL